MRIFLFSLGLALALALGTFRASAQDATYGPGNIDDETGSGAASDSIPGESASMPTGSISFQQFYNALGQFGTWTNTDKYGYVFQPTETDPNWAPYTNGRWVHSDAGLTWSGNDAFSWATDHYGRWVNLEGTGWVWVPGYTWGPGWVSWRQSDDGNDVGWAPLPPDSNVGIDYYGDNDAYDYGYHIGDDADEVYGIGPWWYTWVPTIWFGDPFCYRHYWGRGDNFARIGHSHNVTNINFRRGGTSNFASVRAAGPSIASLNARSQTPVQNVSLARASTLNSAGLRNNGTLGVFAPAVDPSTRSTSRPSGVSGFAQSAQINRGLDVSHGLAVNSRLNSPGATGAQVEAANAARANFTNARVATSGGHFNRSFSGSFNTVRTSPSAPSVFTSNARSPGFRSSASPSFNAPTTHVFNTTPSMRTFSNPGSSNFHTYNAPSSSFHTFTPSTQTVAPSFHSAPSFSGGGSFHSSGGGFSGGGASHVSTGGGGFSGGGGGHSGGGGFSGGGGHR